MTVRSVPNRLSAFLAGFGLGVLVLFFVFCSHVFEWMNTESKLYLIPPVVIFGFGVPVYRFVIGPPNLEGSSPRNIIHVWGRLVLYFVGWAVAMLVGEGLKWLFAV